jgi:Mlc titration factor MtfA (ptsG expression regulator)
MASGGWEGYNLVIHELAHKLDMLNGDANGLPPLHRHARQRLGQRHARRLRRPQPPARRPPHAKTAIDPYAAENPAEFFAVTSEYFFSAPDLLHEAYPQVYLQLKLSTARTRWLALQAHDPVYQAQDEDRTT